MEKLCRLGANGLGKVQMRLNEACSRPCGQVASLPLSTPQHIDGMYPGGHAPPMELHRQDMDSLKIETLLSL